MSIGVPPASSFLDARGRHGAWDRAASRKNGYSWHAARPPSHSLGFAYDGYLPDHLASVARAPSCVLTLGRRCRQLWPQWMAMLQLTLSFPCGTDGDGEKIYIVKLGP
jgi:hypothetical protein